MRCWLPTRFSCCAPPALQWLRPLTGCPSGWDCSCPYMYSEVHLLCCKWAAIDYAYRTRKNATLYRRFTESTQFPSAHEELHWQLRG
ncbi:hypothetical protein M440DRAFT_1126703 [Trichoderma longibrachiatum ATCC 18648]|uniref:Uncharacterized protein n=1 Tax=Trichoderma longibrachiatum ATCC 18648 TaxID=983965 RepID=A0A2T4CFW2_TRILO|nr:hypothetical protein M440DRAFT_1126703 [Trichoderma longibrachiatum ATCC 18648]